MNSDAMGRRIELEPGILFFSVDIFFLLLLKDSEPAFEFRQITIRKEKWITDEFDLLEFLGRYRL